MENWKSGRIHGLDELRSRLKEDLEKEMSDSETKKLTFKNQGKLKELGKAKDSLIKLEGKNYLRSAELVQFVKKQLQKFSHMGSKILANQLKYTSARKKIWMENDELNRMENQKVYEDELRLYVLRFNMIKAQINKNFLKIEKNARKNAQKFSEKILVNQIKKYAKRLNEEYQYDLRADYDTYWAEEVRLIREIDHEFEKGWKDDMKMANLAVEKFK